MTHTVSRNDFPFLLQYNQWEKKSAKGSYYQNVKANRDGTHAVHYSAESLVAATF